MGSKRNSTSDKIMRMWVSRYKAKGQISLAIIASLAIGFIVLATTIGPNLINIINASGVKGDAAGLLMLLVPALFGMIIVAALLWATGRKPPGYWGQ
jgi:hypothetical protein